MGKGWEKKAERWRLPAKHAKHAIKAKIRISNHGGTETENLNLADTGFATRLMPALNSEGSLNELIDGRVVSINAQERTGI